MTDEIDLDRLDEADDEPAEESDEGDWFWREEDAPEPSDAPDAAEGSGEPTAASTDEADAAATGSADDGDGPAPVPHVPRADEGKPAGIPMESGGSGGGTGRESDGTDQASGGAEPPDAASGPHGGDADDMTLAFSYGAVKRLGEPAAVFADANRWADWLGIVGDVGAPVVNKFQREHSIDADFFNGSGTGPSERLAEIDEHSMFYADRFVLVGLEGSDESWAPEGWEFVPLTTAAEAAEWELTGE